MNRVVKRGGTGQLVTNVKEAHQSIPLKNHLKAVHQQIKENLNPMRVVSLHLEEQGHFLLRTIQIPADNKINPTSISHLSEHVIPKKENCKLG